MEIVSANAKTIEQFSKVLVEAALWLESEGQLMWKANDLTSKELLRKYSIDEMKLCYQNDKLIGVFILQWLDQLFWPDINEKESGFLHKLAVCKEYRKLGNGNKLVDSAELICRDHNVGWIRLNCGTFRPRLRNFYESVGFQMVDRVFVDNRDQIRYEKNLKM